MAELAFQPKKSGFRVQTPNYHAILALQRERNRTGIENRRKTWLARKGERR